MSAARIDRPKPAIESVLAAKITPHPVDIRSQSQREEMGEVVNLHTREAYIDPPIHAQHERSCELATMTFMRKPYSRGVVT